MAALVRHGIFKTGPVLTRKNVFVACYATKAEKKKGIDRKVPPKIDTSSESIAAKGFLRPQNEYIPPNDLENKLETIFKNCVGSTNVKEKLKPEKKYELLNACFKEFNHGVPNSLLHKIETLEEVQFFYKTPVNVTTPFDKLRNMELPPNLHVQFEYHRFHPDTDKMFDGVTAFPRSSTLVTGLKYKGKYKGHIQATQWPYTS